MNLLGKKHPYYGTSMSTNFLGSPYTMGFVGFFREPISQAFPIRWVFLPFPMLWETDEKNHAFPVWWRVPLDWSLMEKSTHFKEKVWEPISQAFPIRWVSMTFLILWEIWWESPCISHVKKYTIAWESNGKKHPYYGKSMSINFPVSPHTMGFVRSYREPISQASLIQWVWLSFPMIWEIDKKIHAFPMWWSIP